MHTQEAAHDSEAGNPAHAVSGAYPMVCDDGTPPDALDQPIAYRLASYFKVTPDAGDLRARILLTPTDGVFVFDLADRGSVERAHDHARTLRRGLAPGAEISVYAPPAMRGPWSGHPVIGHAGT